MSAADLAAVVIAVAALALVGLAVVMMVQLRRSAENLAVAVDEVRLALAERMGALDDRSAAIAADMDRAGGLLDTAEKVTARADTLSRMTYGAVAKPVIKTAAVVKGTSRAARALRRGGADGDERTG